MRIFIIVWCLLMVSCGGGTRLISDVFENQQLKITGELKSNKQEGIWKYYYDDGSIKSEGAWLHDYQNGPWTYYYKNANKKQAGHYVSKLRHGEWTYWYENARVKTTGSYNNDRQDGLWFYYTESARLFAVGSFVDGLKHGVWQWYDTSGNPADNGMFYQGQRVGPWIIDGAVINKGVPVAFQASIGSNEDRHYWSMLDAQNKIILSIMRYGKLIGGSYDAQHNRVCAFQDSKIIGLQTGELLVMYSPAGQIRYDGKVWKNQDNEPSAKSIEQLQILRSGLKGIRSQFNKLALSIEKAKAPPSIEELIVSKQDRPALTPVVQIDSMWTKREEKKVTKLISRYKRFMPGDDDSYSSGFKKRTMNKDWMGKLLPQTRFFNYTGKVIDLNSFKGKKSVSVIVMRGFAGQVCIYCTAQTRVLAEKIEAFKALDNEVVIVYPGPAETIPMFRSHGCRRAHNDTLGCQLHIRLGIRSGQA